MRPGCDIDIVDFRGQARDDNLQLPHPRMHQRGFVLIPLRDLDPHWQHPVSGASIDSLIAALDPVKMCFRRNVVLRLRDN